MILNQFEILMLPKFPVLTNHRPVFRSRDQYWPTTGQYSPNLEHARAEDVSQEGKGHAGRPEHQGQQLDQQTNPGVGDIVQGADVVLGTGGG